MALLPCHVIVRELGASHTGVTFLDPIVVLGLKDNPIAEVRHEAHAQLTRVRDRLSGEQSASLLERAIRRGNNRWCYADLSTALRGRPASAISALTFVER